MALEHEYLHLLERCLNAPLRDTRNAKVHSVFSASLSHNLAESFPLITTKRVFFRGVVEELAWFLRGSTNVTELHERGVKIWDKNADAFDPIHKADAGGIYGFLWRYFGAKYKDCNTDYTDQGLDQIASIIRGLKEDPHSRRHILNAWNPTTPASLPPCHVLYQFYVHDNTVSVQMYQRSADLFLGVPFNIASTALLTHLIAHEVSMNVGTMNITFGDCHIYENHTKAVMEQLGRFPRQMPQLSIVRPKDGLWNVDADEITLLNYSPEPTIRADMIA